MRISAKESISHNTTKILDNNKQAYGISSDPLRIQKLQSKRAVSDIIVSLLLVAITVVMGIIMFGIVKDTGIAESVTSEVSQPLTFEGGIKISAYDARDGADLMGLADVDNSASTDGKLKSDEYIVLKITNNNPNSIFLNDVIVNEVSHTFDTDATLPPSPGGKYSIIPGTDDEGTTPQSSTEFGGGKSVRIVVKLGSMSDISINDAIRIEIGATEFDLQNFIITAGHTR